MELSITLVLALLNVVISLMAFNNESLYRKLVFNPYAVHHFKEYVRVAGHAFIHADWIHLLFNMYVLYQFGGLLEDIFTSPDLFARLFPGLDFWGLGRGRLYYLMLYVGGLLSATLPAFRKHANNPGYNAVGASGAVSAVVMAFILMLPTVKLTLFFIPIGIPAFLLGAAYLGYEFYMSKRQHGTGIAHDAHLWGGLFGLLFILLLSPAFGKYFIQQVATFLGW